MTKQVTKTVEEAKAPALSQFPSELGENAVEVSERSPDQSQPSNDFVKVFVVKGRDLAGDKEMHARNAVAVLQEAIERGLHPTAEARYVSAKNLEDGVSSAVTYKVAVIPAHVDHVAGDAVTPSKVLDK